MFNVTSAYSELQRNFRSLAFYKQHLSQQDFCLEERITNVEQIKWALRCYLLIAHFFLRFLLTTGMQHLSSWGRQLFYWKGVTTDPKTLLHHTTYSTGQVTCFSKGNYMPSLCHLYSRKNQLNQRNCMLRTNDKVTVLCCRGYLKNSRFGAPFTYCNFFPATGTWRLWRNSDMHLRMTAIGFIPDVLHILPSI